ncbi:VOC family protein [Candidatus Peregrinibacteria bacterium]|nr:MAG: VOC family protein [Candidatus Peregrinibacteria bacterium]
MQKIVPHLWFDKEAVEAAEWYTSIFDDSKILFKNQIKNTPSGDCDIVGFQLRGYEFQAISAGPYFKLNPSISIMVNFDPSQEPNARERMSEIWKRLMEGGKALMPLDQYPFSEWYGWVQDKYGFSWQLILTDPKGEERPRMMPSMLFVGDVCGKAEEASDFYLSVFKDAKRGAMARYPAGMEPDKAGTVMFTDFMLEGQWFVAMDSAHQHEFGFNEAVSLMVCCNDQAEIDAYWEKLSAVPESEQCGWVKDAYGVSWQIVPKNMGELMAKNPEVNTAKMLKMKKIMLSEFE